jgi:hypothetical protein
MKIELTQYQENEDGSVNCHVDMDKEATHHLINYALVNMLTKAVEEGKLYTPDTYVAEVEAEVEAEEEDVNYFYDEDEDVEYYYVEDEDAWYYYDEAEDDWFVVEEDEVEDEDDTVWVALESEQIDSIFVKELKKCLINTYHNTSSLQEDIDDNIRVRNASKVLLSYYMIPSEADEYIGLTEFMYEFEGA